MLRRWRLLLWRRPGEACAIHTGHIAAPQVRRLGHGFRVRCECIQEEASALRVLQRMRGFLYRCRACEGWPLAAATILAWDPSVVIASENIDTRQWGGGGPRAALPL